MTPLDIAEENAPMNSNQSIRSHQEDSFRPVGASVPASSSVPQSGSSSRARTDVPFKNPSFRPPQTSTSCSSAITSTSRNMTNPFVPNQKSTSTNRFNFEEQLTHEWTYPQHIPRRSGTFSFSY
jgi:hypothetical protein